MVTPQRHPPLQKCIHPITQHPSIPTHQRVTGSRKSHDPPPRLGFWEIPSPTQKAKQGVPRPVWWAWPVGRIPSLLLW